MTITELLDTLRARMGHDFSVTVHRSELEAIIVERERFRRSFPSRCNCVECRKAMEFYRRVGAIPTQDANEV